MADPADEGDGFIFVETALTFIPQLVRIPVLGRIITALFGGALGGNDLHALEKYQDLLQRRKVERQTRIQRQARYVLKASDAMQCVEDNLMDGGILLALGKGLIHVLLESVRPSGLTAIDVLSNKIFTCIESKTLKQTSQRVRETRTYSARPARGHGRGRGGVLPTPTP